MGQQWQHSHVVKLLPAFCTHAHRHADRQTDRQLDIRKSVLTKLFNNSKVWHTHTHTHTHIYIYIYIYIYISSDA